MTTIDPISLAVQHHFQAAQTLEAKKAELEAARDRQKALDVARKKAAGLTLSDTSKATQDALKAATEASEQNRRDTENLEYMVQVARDNVDRATQAVTDAKHRAASIKIDTLSDTITKQAERIDALADELFALVEAVETAQHTMTVVANGELHNSNTGWPIKRRLGEEFERAGRALRGGGTVSDFHHATQAAGEVVKRARGGHYKAA